MQNRIEVEQAPKKYRLLSVGEIIAVTDEVWGAFGWNRASVGNSQGLVVWSGMSPVRREIDEYIGGPA